MPLTVHMARLATKSAGSVQVDHGHEHLCSLLMERPFYSRPLHIFMSLEALKNLIMKILWSGASSINGMSACQVGCVRQ